LRRRYSELFGGDELPVPVAAIAEDLLGLAVEEAEIDCSGILLPAERRILLNISEPDTRRRFTIAHELGHWVCQCLEGRTAPLYCRAEEIGLAAPEARALEREANVFASELLMPEVAVREAWAGMGVADAVAARLDVSPSAMGWRLFNFGLVEEKPL
jgi:Zn-dependent peptidase ImmA (M78 family)